MKHSSRKAHQQWKRRRQYRLPSVIKLTSNPFLNSDLGSLAWPHGPGQITCHDSYIFLILNQTEDEQMREIIKKKLDAADQLLKNHQGVPIVWDSMTS